MKIEFYRASGTDDDPNNASTWAETEFGSLTPGAEEGTVLYIQPHPDKELLLTFEAPEIPKESLESIAENILRKGFPVGAMPPDYGEALFFTVVNDALTKLKEMQKAITEKDLSAHDEVSR